MAAFAYYPNPRRGLHVGGSAGLLAASNVDRACCLSTHWGAALSVRIGYDIFFSRRWSVGAVAHLRLGQVNNERVTEFLGKLRLEGFSKRGRPPRSSTPEAVRKRRQRALGNGEEERERRQQPRRQGLSEKSIRNVRATLRTVLAFAVRWGYLSHLPDLPEVVVPEGSFDWYQPHEAARLVEAARDAWERALLLFPLHTGVRLGEQRAMRSTDVDFELARVYVRRSAPSGFDTIKAPKSNRQRSVDLTPELAAALRTIRHRAERIFCSDAGSMLRPGQFQEVLWAAQKRAALRRIKWHDLRHSRCSPPQRRRAPARRQRRQLGPRRARTPSPRLTNEPF